MVHINLLKDDGYTPLHLAALNDHLDVVTAFAEVVSKCMSVENGYNYNYAKRL